MAGSTTYRALPYPTGTDVSGPTAIQTLITDIDEKLDVYRHTTGSKQISNIAMYEEKAANLSGYIMLKTKIPYTVTDNMMSIKIQGYTYLGIMNIIDLTFNFRVSSSTVQNADVINNGTMMFSDVKIVRETSTGFICIALLPDVKATGVVNMWQYPKLTADAWLGTAEISVAATTGWSFVRAATLTGYTTITTLVNHNWIYVTSFFNNWVNYDGGGFAGHVNARYRRVGGIVEVEGLVKNGGVTSGATIFTLPIGFRPNGQLIFQVTTDALNGRIDLATNGSINISSATNGYLSLSNIVFPADDYIAPP